MRCRIGDNMEIWKDINGFEDFYEVSNCGQIRSKDRIRKIPFGRECVVRGKILKQQPNSNGYLRVSLSNGKGKKEKVFVHRVVAQAFVANPQNLPVVNHLDFDYTNNNADNLEWTTLKGNVQYSLVRGRFKRTEKWLKNLKKSLDIKMGKSVVGINETTGEMIFFKALNDCAGAGFQPSCVSNCCTGKRKHHLGFVWRFANEM